MALLLHCTDTVTPFWLVFPPIDTVIGRSPDGAFAGICTLSCIIPATRPGASPAYAYDAGWPLISTPTASAGAGVTCGGGKVAVVIAPVTLGGLVWPSPVMNTCTMLPLAARLPGPFRPLSWFRMAPGPLPAAFCAKIPGAA